MSETTLIAHGVVITIDGENRIFEDGSIVIRGDSILDIGPSSQVEGKYQADRLIDATGKAIIPGLINAHFHSGLIRGIGDDLPLYEWHEKYADRVSRALTAEDAYIGGLLSYAEAVKSGTTCVLDMCHMAGECLKAGSEIGIRAILAPYVSEQAGATDSFEENLKWVQELSGKRDDRVRFWFSFDSFRDITPELIKEICRQARKYRVGIHTHANESNDDIKRGQELYGLRPIEFLYDIGAMGPDVVLAHCVWLSEREIELLRATKTKVVHNPVSNMKLADGVAPITRLLREQIEVGLGTDGISVNNNCDMIAVLKIAILLQRVSNLSVEAIGSARALEMATRMGARVLGLGDRVGSLEKGKKADIVIIDLGGLRLTPVLLGDNFNVVSQLVYSANGSDVETVIIDGKMVVEDRELKTVDEETLIRKANAAAKELMNRV